MNESKAREVVAWLNGIPHGLCRNAVPVSVTIGKQTFYGARYDSLGHYVKGMRAVDDGSHKDGEEYMDVRYYLIGEKPIHRRQTVYRIGDDTRDWYAGGYFTGPPNQFHPFGRNFSLNCWDVSGKVDDGERYAPWPRLVITVQEL